MPEFVALRPLWINEEIFRPAPSGSLETLRIGEDEVVVLYAGTWEYRVLRHSSKRPSPCRLM